MPIRQLYIGLGVIILLVATIWAFQNVYLTVSVFLFFQSFNLSAALLFFLMLFMGTIAGALLALGYSQKSDDDTDDSFGGN